MIMNNNIAAAHNQRGRQQPHHEIVKDYAVTNNHRITNDNGFMDNHVLAEHTTGSRP